MQPVNLPRLNSDTTQDSSDIVIVNEEFGDINSLMYGEDQPPINPTSVPNNKTANKFDVGRFSRIGWIRDRYGPINNINLPPNPAIHCGQSILLLLNFPSIAMVMVNVLKRQSV